MNVLLLSAYDADSHRRWRSLLQGAFEDYRWTVLTLPPRFFSWRQRGNSLSWAFAERERLNADYDLLIATSVVDLSALRGLVPSLGRIPALVYFHENQFAYPVSEQQFPSIEPHLLNLYTALAADRVLFNSDYNRRTFMEGAAAMLDKFPDKVPPGLVERIDARSEVIPVPLETACFRTRQARRRGPLQVVWNHRWEYDKGPERLLAVVRQLALAAVPVVLHIVGRQFRTQPPAFAAIRSVIEGSDCLRLGNWGFIEAPAAYRDLLSSVDVVLSTALHDFQGLSVLEAVAAGCIPLVPDRLCYGEWFDDDYRYPSIPDDPDAEARGVVERLRWLRNRGAEDAMAIPDLSRFSIEALKGRYGSVFEGLSNGQVAGE